MWTSWWLTRRTSRGTRYIVKSWQYGWFVFVPSVRVLEYFLLEDRSGKCRGSQQMSGAVRSPSQEDENTFLINFISGEHYKVRASSVMETQIWVDKLRHCVMNLQSVMSRPDALQTIFSKQKDITKIIESLPVPKPDDTTSPSCDNEKLLMITANSHALVTCL